MAKRKREHHYTVFGYNSDTNQLWTAMVSGSSTAQAIARASEFHDDGEHHGSVVTAVIDGWHHNLIVGQYRTRLADWPGVRQPPHHSLERKLHGHHRTEGTLPRERAM